MSFNEFDIFFTASQCHYSCFYVITKFHQSQKNLRGKKAVRLHEMMKMLDSQCFESCLFDNLIFWKFHLVINKHLKDENIAIFYI